MRKRFMAIVLVICIVLTLLPTSALAYYGSFTEKVGGETTIEKYTTNVDNASRTYWSLQNDYIRFDLSEDAAFPINFTQPVLNQSDLSQLYTKGIYDANTFSMKYKTSHNGATVNISIKEIKVHQEENTLVADYTFNEESFVATITYSLVNVNEGYTSDHSSTSSTYDGMDDNSEDDGRAWVVKAEFWGGFNPEWNPVDWPSGYFCWTHTLSGFDKMGHLSAAEGAGVNASITTDEFTYLGAGSGTHRFSTKSQGISYGINNMQTNSRYEYETSYPYSDVQVNTYVEEVYSDSYTWANPFKNTVDSRKSNPDSVSYEKYAGKVIHENNLWISTVEGLRDSSSTVWGFRDLYTKAETTGQSPFSPSDEIVVSMDANRLGYFQSGDTLAVESFDSDEALEKLKKAYGADPVAILRGNIKETPTGYQFIGNAAALSPTVTATWGTQGSFTIDKDGTISYKSIALNTPSFKFYEGTTAGLTKLEVTAEGLEMEMNPKENKALVYVNIPYAKTKIEAATATVDGNLTLSGEIGFSTVLDGATFTLEELGYSLNNSQQFTVNGIHATGSIDTASLFNLELAKIEGEINTFKGKETYSFSLELNVFDLFETNAELELKRCESTGVLMPNNLYFYFKTDPGTPIVPPAVIGELNGGGAGFYGLADTVNGDFFAIPPIVLRGTVTGTYLNILEATGNVKVGPGALEFEASNVKFPDLPNANIVDSFGYKFNLKDQKLSYRGVNYTGVALSGSKSIAMTVPNKETLDIVKLNGSIGAEIFGGVDSIKDPKKLYLRANGNGTIGAILKTPDSWPVIGGVNILGVNADATIVGQTVVGLTAKDTVEETLKQGCRDAYKNLDAYLGIAATATVAKSDVRVWVIVPDVAYNTTKGKYWGWDYALFGSLPAWSWDTLPRESVKYDYAAAQLVKNTPSSQITLNTVAAGEQAYIALAFDHAVTEEALQQVLTITNQTTGNAVPLHWLVVNEKEEISASAAATATVVSSSATKGNGTPYRLVLVHVGGSECSGDTFSISAGDLPFDCDQTSAQPLDRLTASFNGTAVTGKVSYPVSGKTYTLRTYYGTEKGGTDYLMQEQVLSDPANISVTVPTSGDAVATGNYYVSTYLLEEKTGDFDADPATSDETTLVAIDRASFDSAVSYTNVNQPAAPATVGLTAVGNEVMRATWDKVDGAEKYQIMVYQKDDNGDFVDTSYGYILDTSDKTNLPAGVSFDAVTGVYAYNMALTVGDTGKDGATKTLAADKDYQIAVQAIRTVSEMEYYSAATRSNEENLPKYTQLDMSVSVDGVSLTMDEETRMYTATIRGTNSTLSVQTGDSASITVTDMRTNTVIIEENSSYRIPNDFSGSLMLSVTASQTNGSRTDTTTGYVLVYLDDVAPIITLDNPVYYADPDTGEFSVTGTTEPGAVLNYGAKDENDALITATAAADGSFSMSGALENDTEEKPLRGKVLNLSATDAAGNSAENVLAIISLPSKTYAVTIVDGGTGVAGNGSYEAGETVSIDAGARSGYTFNGWTSDQVIIAQPTQAQTSFVMPEKAVQVTANWVENTPPPATYYTLSFETNGGNVISPVSRTENTTISLSDYTPIRNGFVFTGWYSDKNLTSKITSIRLTKDTTVYAGWRDESTPDPDMENPFTDVLKTSWFYNDVMFVYANELMMGTSGNKFSPYVTTTRGMLTTTLWRMEGCPEGTDTSGFTDVQEGKWYAKAINWASKNNIAMGYGNNKFGPDDTMTREQMVTMLYRFAQYKGYDVSAENDTSILSFTDAASVSRYATQSMQWACGADLIRGEHNKLLPQGSAIRAQVAAVLHRFRINIAK